MLTQYLAAVHMEQTCISYDQCNFTGATSIIAATATTTTTTPDNKLQMQSHGNYLIKLVDKRAFLYSDFSCFEAFNQFELYKFQQLMGVTQLTDCTEQNNVLMERRELYCELYVAMGPRDNKTCWIGRDQQTGDETRYSGSLLLLLRLIIEVVLLEPSPLSTQAFTAGCLQPYQSTFFASTPFGSHASETLLSLSNFTQLFE